MGLLFFGSFRTRSNVRLWIWQRSVYGQRPSAAWRCAPCHCSHVVAPSSVRKAISFMQVKPRSFCLVSWSSTMPFAWGLIISAVWG